MTTASRSQAWSFDPLGNWSSLTTDGTAVSRTHNKQNQVTAVGSANLTFDANGNTTTDETGKQFVYDAWNRLVRVKDSGGATLTSYQVDALNRRIVENPGTARDLYYSSAWQVLEERISGAAHIQYVWSPVYIDALVLRDRDADSNSGNGLEERLWAQQDANWNVVALLSSSGSINERDAYDAYGSAAILSANWSNLSNSAQEWRYFHQGGRFDDICSSMTFRWRDYSPQKGRWLQNDPAGYRAGDANLYRYVANNPLNQIDPSGLIAFFTFVCVVSVFRVPVCIANTPLICFGCTQAAVAAAAPVCGPTCCNGPICLASRGIVRRGAIPTPHFFCLVNCVRRVAGCTICL